MRAATLFALFAAAAPAANPPVKIGPRTAIRVPYWSDGSPAGPVSAKVNGQPAKVTRTLSPDDDLMMLLVLDLAGDLAQADPAREAVIAAAGKLPPNAYVGLLRAQDGLRVLSDPSPDRGPLAETIRALNIGGRAGLLDTVETAAQLGDAVLAKSAVRVAILYITDSSIGNYREDFTNPVVNSGDSRDMSRRFPEGLVKEKISRLSASLGSAETPLFIVHLNYQSDRISEAYQTGLLEIATASAGTAVFCRSVAEIPSAIDQAFASIGSHRSLEIQLPPGKARQWDVELAGEGGALRYRQRISGRK